MRAQPTATVTANIRVTRARRDRVTGWSIHCDQCGPAETVPAKKRVAVQAASKHIVEKHAGLGVVRADI